MSSHNFAPQSDRRCRSAAPQLQARFSHWTSTDPVAVAQSKDFNSDHWAKLRLKHITALQSAQQKHNQENRQSYTPDMEVVNLPPYDASIQALELALINIQRENNEADRHRQFELQNGRIPLNGYEYQRNDICAQTMSRPKTSPAQLITVKMINSPNNFREWHRKKLATSLNDRARQNFRYWLTQRPPKTPFGHYSMGTKHTFLGLSYAPRS